MSKEYSFSLNTTVHVNRYILPNPNREWTSISIFDVPREQFDLIEETERTFSDFWSKTMDLGASNSITVFCNEPPTEKSE